LRGLGVGVRVGAEYVLFDRNDRIDATEAIRGRQVSTESTYVSARAWLRAHGVAVEPDFATARKKFSETFGSEALDHVGFTSADIAAVAATLGAHRTPFRQTADSSFYRTDGGGVVEILRDLDAPDAFWCPMHVDVRSAGAGSCPICGMTLVPIPAARLGEYRMDVTVVAGSRGTGASRLRITVRDPASGRPVPAFTPIHERVLHLFIVDRQLEYFRHLHPKLTGEGVFELRQELPPGEYVLIADFLPQGGQAQLLQRAIVTPGYHGPLFPPAPVLRPETSADSVEGGVRVHLDAGALTAGKEGRLAFTLSDVASGAPVSDLESFLGAPGHLLMVDADLTEADHVHPEESATSGPSISFRPLMPAAGVYKLWFQFQRRGVVITTAFVVSVQGP
jgi:heavy metal-binding protein